MRFPADAITKGREKYPEGCTALSLYVADMIERGEDRQQDDAREFFRHASSQRRDIDAFRVFVSDPSAEVVEMTLFSIGK